MANHSLKESLRYRHLTSLKALEQRFPQAGGAFRLLLADAGPFWGYGPYRDAFRFDNHGWPLTEDDARLLRERFQSQVDAAKTIGLAAVHGALDAVSVDVPLAGSINLPDFVISYVINAITGDLSDQLLDKIVSGVAGDYGRCGGMAFAGLDYFLAGRDVPDDAQQPAPCVAPLLCPLRDYIWTRLLDSLDLNAGAFLEWVMQLHVLPVISRIASAAIGAAAGALGGPVGAAIGALIAGSDDVLGLGGPKVLVERTRGELDRIKQQLDGGPAWPIGLIYGDTPYVWEQHQVLALRYQDLGGGRLQLTVWNNNDGRTEEAWNIDPTGDELTVTWTGSHPIKGIICDDYNFRVPPAG